MKRIICLAVLFLTAMAGFAEDPPKSKGPAAPKPPAKPVVQSANENAGYPKFPPPPVLPERPNGENQDSGPERVIEKYDLNISGAYPNGNTRNNVAKTITNAQYTLRSNKTAVIKLSFNNGLEYTYHLRNPRAKIEISAGVFRETFDTLVQAGSRYLLEQYTSELCYDGNSITSFNLIGGDKTLVFINFSRKN